MAAATGGHVASPAHPQYCLTPKFVVWCGRRFQTRDLTSAKTRGRRSARDRETYGQIVQASATDTWARRFPASERREQRTRDLLLVARSADVTDAEAAALRNEAVVLNRALALAIARRYHHKGVDDEDLDQVAMVGLCLAIDRLGPLGGDPLRGLRVADHRR